MSSFYSIVFWLSLYSSSSPMNVMHSKWVVFTNFFTESVVFRLLYSKTTEISRKLWNRKTTLKQYFSVFDVVTNQQVLLIFYNNKVKIWACFTLFSLFNWCVSVDLTWVYFIVCIVTSWIALIIIYIIV